MINNLLLITTALIVILNVKGEDKKWVWGENSKNNGRSFGLRDEAASRYDVYEEDGPYNSYPINNEPEQFLGPNVNRPGGVHDINNPLYGEGQGPYYPNNRPAPGILTGPIPDGPFKEYDRCKCTERFNCNSPGISYGHCDVGKRYCCYSTKKSSIEGSFPSRPVHSPENGILVGPGGPVGGNYNRRPPIGGFAGPVKTGGFGLGGGRPVGAFTGQNIYSPENGVLVGPGGPSRPYFGLNGGFNRRSANK